MANALTMLLAWSWRGLVIAAVWVLLRELIKNGGQTIQTLVSTMGLAIRAGCMILKQHLWLKIKEERRPEPIEPAGDTGEPVKAEGTVR